MIQPPRVLPSNAPPLRDEENLYQPARVLQENSGNRQQGPFCSGDDFEQKYQSSTLNENGYSNLRQHTHPQYQQQQHPQLYHPQPQHRQAWRYGYARRGFPFPGPEDEARLRYDAERLYTRFRKSDQYIKYRNRQTKDDKGNGDQKWPDHLEKAFFRALVQYPPMGRRKTMHKNKQRGRNELIADCIEELTGEARSRKQVSSHIQVLKPFVEGDPYIMKWLAKDDICGRDGRYHGTGSSYPGGRRLSNYPVTAPPHALRTNLPSMARTDFQALQKVKGDLDIFKPIDFQMFVQRNHKVSEEHDEVQRLHTYTKSIDSPLVPDLRLADTQVFRQEYPFLAAMHAQRPFDCNVLDADASLAFPIETWKNKDGSPLPGVELGIYFLCTSRHLPPTPAIPTPGERTYGLVVNNTFYENGVLVKEHSGPTEARLELSERDGNVETRIKFGSTFWARTLGRLAGRLLDASKDHSEEVGSYLRSINAVQEIISWSDRGPERLLVMHWRFRHSSATRGRASWRKLILPTSANGQVKGEGVDVMYEYIIPGPETSEPQDQQQSSLPMLQSPFEYESGSASALSSATWPTSLSDGSFAASQVGTNEFTADNSFDFNAGNINLAYDANLTFDSFDTSAFNFDTPAADFAADPALQEYAQQWYEGCPDTFQGQQAVAGTDSFSIHPEVYGVGQAYHEHAGHYDQRAYVNVGDHQAYGGAGEEIMRDDDALAALADASFMASAIGAKQEPM